MSFKLKDRVKDSITGYIGIITAKSEYLNGETRYLIEAMDNTGRPVEWWIEESRLSLDFKTPKIGTRIKIINAGFGAHGANGNIGVVTDKKNSDGLLEVDPGYNVEIGCKVWRIHPDANVEISEDISVEEMRTALERFCDSTKCCNCVLTGREVCRCGWGTHFKTKSFDGSYHMTDDEIRDAYNRVFKKKEA